MAYQIFDSMDKPCSLKTENEQSLLGQLETLREENEEEEGRYTYAIGKWIGNEVTYDF
jgi:hypothetical protein